MVLVVPQSCANPSSRQTASQNGKLTWRRASVFPLCRNGVVISKLLEASCQAATKTEKILLPCNKNQAQPERLPRSAGKFTRTSRKYGLAQRAENPQQITGASNTARLRKLSRRFLSCAGSLLRVPDAVAQPTLPRGWGKFTRTSQRLFLLRPRGQCSNMYLLGLQGARGCLRGGPANCAEGPWSSPL